MMVDVLPTEVEDFHLSSPFLSSDSETDDDSNGSYRYNLDSDTDITPESLVGIFTIYIIYIIHLYITTLDLFCGKGFLRAISHPRQSIICEM